MTYPPAYPPPQGYSGPPNPQYPPQAAYGSVPAGAPQNGATYGQAPTPAGHGAYSLPRRAQFRPSQCCAHPGLPPSRASPIRLRPCRPPRRSISHISRTNRNSSSSSSFSKARARAPGRHT